MKIARSRNLMQLLILGPTTPLRGHDGGIVGGFSPFRQQNLPHRWAFVFGHLVEAYRITYTHICCALKSVIPSYQSQLGISIDLIF